MSCKFIQGNMSDGMSHFLFTFVWSHVKRFGRNGFHSINTKSWFMCLCWHHGRFHVQGCRRAASSVLLHRRQIWGWFQISYFVLAKPHSSAFLHLLTCHDKPAMCTAGFSLMVFEAEPKQLKPNTVKFGHAYSVLHTWQGWLRLRFYCNWNGGVVVCLMAPQFS